MSAQTGTKPLADQEARNAVKTKLDQNILLEAGAGSGKTSAMAGRFLELINSQRADLSEIVAITFTKKAANELGERIRKKLAEVDSPLADELHRSFIGTIHSFCGMLLRERPIEAGVDPQFSEIDDGEDAAILDTVWNEYVMNADLSRNQILARLDLFNLNTDALKQFLKIVCDNPDLEFELPGESPADLDGFLTMVDQAYAALVRLIEATVKKIPDLEQVEAGKRDALQLTIERTLPKIRRRQPLSAVEKINLLKWFHTTTKISVVQKCWGNSKEEKTQGKEIGKAFAEFKLEIVAPVFELRGQYGYNHVAVPFVKEAKGIYEARKKALSVLNFQDLLQKAADLLEGNPEVRQYFQKKYRYLLVDEFQDTDPVQARLMMYLTGQELTESRWDAITPIPGSLFVVGDPKQSIYSFRRADISIYQRFKERMVETGGQVVEFTTNFRSVNELGVWFNKLFPDLFQMGKVIQDLIRKGKEKVTEFFRSLQALFSSADTVKDSHVDTIAGVFKYKCDADARSGGMAMDMDHIERIIRYLTSCCSISVPVPGDETGATETRRIAYKDIMVLFQKKAQLTSYGKVLSQRGIPVKTTGADVVQRTAQFQALSDLIRMLAYPEENALLYKVLRGPVFQFSDSELFTYAELGGRFYIYTDVAGMRERIRARIAEPGNTAIMAEHLELLERIQLTFDLLVRFASYMRMMVPAAATERIIDDLGMTANMLADRESLTELSSFFSLVEKIRMNKLTNVWDLNQFVEEINVMIQSGYEEEIDLAVEGQNTVRMMNLHKAKGLEAPIVILATPFSGRVKQPNLYVDRSRELGDGDYGIARIKLGSKFYSKEFISPAAWNEVSDLAMAKAEAEQVRLLYVAATRAGNALIISDSSAKDNPWAPLLAEIEVDKDKSMLLGGSLLVKGKEDESPEEEDEGFIRDINRIIVKSGFNLEDARKDTAPEAGAAAGNGAGTGDDAISISIEQILQRTRKALTEREPSYLTYTPSEKASKKMKVSEVAGAEVTARSGSDEFPGLPDLDPDLILDNSMEIHLEGDQEVFRRLRTQLGTAVHLVFEGMIRGNRDQEQLISHIVRQIDEQQISEKVLREVYRQFKDSSLYTRIRQASQVYTEVPIAIKVPAGETFAGTTFERDCYVNGSIDLVLQETDGWTVVDYKTCARTEVKSELVQRYQPQLDAYKAAWEMATGEQVVKTEIFFIEKT